MSYRFELNTSYQRLRRYGAQVSGGLRARKVFDPHATSWAQMKQRIKREREQREEADDAVLEASTVTRVEDADNDAALTAVSGRSWELSNKEASADPHATLFKIPAKRIKSFGAARAVEESSRIVRDGRRFAELDFEKTLDGLETTSARLATAFQAFEAADDALFDPRRAKKALIRDINALIAVTEAAILTAFPGRDDIVSAILQPWFERKAKRKTAGAGTEGTTENDPLVPDIDDSEEEPTA